MEAFDPNEFTKYEKARMIGSRSLQIAMGAPFLIKLEQKDIETIKYNPVAIAKMEFDKGVIPLTILRPLPKPITEGGSIEEVSTLGKKLVKEIQEETAFLQEGDAEASESTEDVEKDIISEPDEE